MQNHKDNPAQLPIRPDWLEMVEEAALERDLPIIDPHVHLWDPPGRRYLLDEHLADLASGHDVTASIFIECLSMYRAEGPTAFRPVGETEFAAGLAAQSASGRYGPSRIAAAIVSHVDYTLGDRFAPVIEAHLAASGGRLRGFRGRMSSHADENIDRWRTPSDILRDGTLRETVATIGRYGLSIDSWIYQTQLEEFADLCSAFPDQRFVLCHSGGPIACAPYADQRAEMFAAWKRGLAGVAERPNVSIKLSGLGMRYAGFDFFDAPSPPTSVVLAEAYRPYLETCIELFGPERSMFASNFPADKASSSYAVLWNAFKRSTTSFSPAERADLFSETARRTYRLA